MNRKFFPLISAFLALPLAARADALGMAHPWQLGFQDAATPVMENLTWLHNDFLLYIITAVAAFVLLITLYVCVRYHKSVHPTPTGRIHNTPLEIIWTVIPIFILVAIAIPSLREHYYQQRVPKADLTLKVVGHQWYWSYEYPDNGGIAFDSYMIKDADIKPGQVRLLSVDNPVVVPVDSTVRVQLTGADVIHSWAVPAFGFKKDAVPGRLNESWFNATKIGTFYGQCSELCGVGHGFMPIEVQVVSKDDFAAWLDAHKPKAAAPAAAPAPAKAVPAPKAAPAAPKKESSDESEK